MARKYKFCPGCQAEVDREFRAFIENAPREQLIKILMGFREKLEKNGNA